MKVSRRTANPTSTRRQHRRALLVFSYVEAKAAGPDAILEFAGHINLYFCVVRYNYLFWIMCFKHPVRTIQRTILYSSC